MNKLDKLHQFCLDHDCTFSLYYERCFFAFVCKIRTIERILPRLAEGNEHKEIAFCRNESWCMAVNGALEEAKKYYE